jgi:Plasmid pRiA4b ORF-3-like protein
MSVYRFKVFFEDDESVYREIEIKAAQTFEDFHKAIQKAINFDDAHPASIFISNDTWRKGKELKLMRDKQNDVKKTGEWMHEIKIAKYIDDPHQKMVYEFDPNGGNWTLFIELVKILPDSPVTYPRVNKTVGTPPLQYKITTPAEVVEDEEDVEEIEEEDNYVKSMPVHYEEDDNTEVEHEIKAHTKTTGADEEEVVEEATEGDGEHDATDDGEPNLEEEDL